MKIKAHIDNGKGEHHIALTMDGNVHSILIPPKPMDWLKHQRRRIALSRSSNLLLQ